MKIYFNALGVISSTDTTDEAIRQGTVGNTIKAYFAGKNNSNFVAKLNFTRPDGSKLSGLIMTPSPSDSTLYTFVLNDDWYLGLAGNATFTIYLYNSSGSIVAQGQVTYPIQATDYDESEEPITNAQYDELLALIASKLDSFRGVKIVDNIALEDMTEFDVGQILYCLTNKQYYVVKNNGSNYADEVEDGNGILGSKRTIVRYEANIDTTTIQSLYDLCGLRLAVINTYLVQFTSEGENILSIRLVDLVNLRSWFVKSNVLAFSNNISAVITSTYVDDIIHDKNKADFVVPYTGATRDVDLGEHSLKTSFIYVADLLHIILVYGNDLIFGSNGNIIIAPDGNAYVGSATENNKIANWDYVARSIASAIESVKANAFILVDTEAYPTLDDFLDDYPAEEGYIYLYPSEVEEEGYLEYIWEGTQWLQIGTTQLDLSNYYNKQEVDDIADDIKASVPKYQVETIFIVDPLTNINGRTFQNYTSERVTIGGYAGYKILKNGNAVSEQEAKEYMEYMTGSYYLPKYNYDKPKNSYFITPDGKIYKPQYDSTNGLVLYDSGNIATKDYVDANKVQRIRDGLENTEIGVYVASNNNGTYSDNKIKAKIEVDWLAIPIRSYSGQIKVPETPAADGDASSKKYVDDSIATAVSAVYRYKGTKTCAEINALTGMVTGDVYNVSDSGTLTAGDIQVRAGDNVAWTGSAWDKLAEDIDWDSYNETFLAAGFLQASEIDSVPENLTFDSEGNITNPDWTGNIAIDYMSPPISDISISDVPATLTFDVTQDYDNMITNADWTGIMTITY